MATTMSRTAYITDILARGFFIFVVLVLLLRRWWLALLLDVGINVLYELTVGRKYWRQWRNQPKKPRRSWRVILRDLWRRVFARERTKGLVFAGIVLLLMSYVVRLQVYYIVVACLVFTMAAVSRFAPPPKSATIPHEPAHDPHDCPPNCPPPATK
ncbi:MAG: hypothetical protein NC133_02865 [Prevotella sp.]|nr:hypothetical protein [Prevotella sp.]